MRKLIILCIGLFLSQQAVAISQCALKAGEKIHCANCTTLDDFALYGAAAVSGNCNYFSSALSPKGQSIRVTGNNGSDVVVTKRTAWSAGSINVTAGKFGEWALNFNYPSPFEAQVEASDLNNIATGQVRNGGRIGYPVLNAKCKQIEKDLEEAKKKKENEARRAFYESIAGRGYRPSSAEIAFLTGQTSSLHFRGERGDPPPCHGINGNSGTRCYRY